MQADYVKGTVRTGKLAPEHRERLEALRDGVSKSRWEMSKEVFILRGDYRKNGIDYPRSEVADACGVMPWDVDEMLLTMERVFWLYDTTGLDICYNAWKYIARHDNPEAFLQHLVRDMDNWGGKFPPVSVIRMKLAASKGNAPPPKPRKWEGKVYRMEGWEDVSRYFITIEIGDDSPQPPPFGTPVTLVEARADRARG